jgi:HAMP domain-containing protein
VRTTVAAVVVVGVAMAAGAVVLVVDLRVTLTREVGNAARARAADVAAVLKSGTRPGELGIDNAEELIQVLDEGGRVVASSPNVAGLPPVARLRPGESAKIDVPVDNDPFLAVATDAPKARLTVVVARALDGVGEATWIVTGLLAVGLPVLLLVVAATTWKVVGRALAPVEAIRGEVDEISAVELHRRVPDPPGTDEIARLAQTMNRMLGRLERATTGSDASSPTPPTSYGHRSPPSASTPRSPSPTPTAPPPPSWQPQSWQRASGSSASWRTCCCWPAPTRTSCSSCPGGPSISTI